MYKGKCVWGGDGGGLGMGVGFGFVIVQCLVVFGAQVCLTLILERKGGYMASSLNLGPS